MRVCTTVALHGMLTTPLAFEQSKKRKLLVFGYELPNICSRNAIFGYALVFSWTCVQSKNGNTPLAVMRNHYTEKGNLGNGHEYSSEPAQSD